MCRLLGGLLPGRLLDKGREQKNGIAEFFRLRLGYGLGTQLGRAGR
jgi:hypothetical protein